MAFTLIGDVVGSRTISDRSGAQQTINAALAVVTKRCDVSQALQATVGDEFQGAFGSLGEAVRAALLVRLELLPTIDVRCGLGEGEITVHDRRRRPVLQDGPGWWSARGAIDELGRPGRSAARTWFRGLDAHHVNAYLLTRDCLVDRLSDRHREMLLLSLGGASQRAIARRLDVSPSAVSQAFSRGVGAVREAEDMFSGQHP